MNVNSWKATDFLGLRGLMSTGGGRSWPTANKSTHISTRPCSTGSQSINQSTTVNANPKSIILNPDPNRAGQIQRRSPKIWNSLPPSLRTCTSPDTVRRHLNTHYCQQAFQST